MDRYISLNGIKYKKDCIVSYDALHKSLIIVLNIENNGNIETIPIQYSDFKTFRLELNKLIYTAIEIEKEKEKYNGLSEDNKPIIKKGLEEADKLHTFSFSLNNILELKGNELKLLMFLLRFNEDRPLCISQDLRFILEMNSFEFDLALKGLINKGYIKSWR